MSSTLTAGLKKEAVIRYTEYVINEAKLYCKKEHLFCGNKKTLEQFVVDMLNRGKREHALHTEKELLTYIKLSLLLGYGFEEDPVFSSLGTFIL